MEREGQTLKVGVSIPFKRESVSERNLKERQLLRSWSVSIPFKRESVSEPGAVWVIKSIIPEFQFPSNGKAYLNFSLVLRLTKQF